MKAEGKQRPYFDELGPNDSDHERVLFGVVQVVQNGLAVVQVSGIEPKDHATGQADQSVGGIDSDQVLVAMFEP